jgi:hypothetical protein
VADGRLLDQEVLCRDSRAVQFSLSDPV